MAGKTYLVHTTDNDTVYVVDQANKTVKRDGGSDGTTHPLSKDGMPLKYGVMSPARPKVGEPMGFALHGDNVHPNAGQPHWSAPVTGVSELS